MNKKSMITIGIAIVLMGIVLMKLQKIENQLDQVDMNMRMYDSGLRSSMESSLSEIKELMKPKNQFLMNHQIEYGTLDLKSMKLPIKVSVTPREYENGSTLELKINDQRVRMLDTGASFSAELEVDPMNGLVIETISTKGNIREVILLEEMENFWEKYAMQIDGNYMRGFEYTNGSFLFKYLGNMNLTFDSPLGNSKVSQIDVYSEIEGQKKLIKTYSMIEGTHFEADLKFDVRVKAGQMHMMYADIQDNMGLHYIFSLTDRMGVNEKDEFIYDKSVQTNMVSEIRDGDGKVLYKPK